MKLFNIENDFKNFILKAVSRFPFAVLYITVFNTLAIKGIITDNDSGKFYILLNTLVMASIYSIAANIALERNKIKLFRYIADVILLIIFTIYYFSFPAAPTNKLIYRTIIIELTGILAVTFISFLRKKDDDRYWEFTYQAVLKGIVSLIYAAVLQIGIFIAFGLIEFLFKTNLGPKFYSIVAVIVYGFFATVLYLSMLPKTNIAPNLDYPKVLRILVIYILIPLTIIYFVILYIYFFRIIFMWQMPEGIVSYLILGFSVLGILTLMMIYPVLKIEDKYKFPKKFAKYYLYAIIPLLVLLFIAVYIRIKNYGITENRYYVIAFAIWLGAVSITSIKNNFSKIIIIPVSFTLLMLLTSFGPWSAFNISKQSQLKRLDKIFAENNISATDTTNVHLVNDSVYDEIYSIVKYIGNTHGFKILDKKYNADLDKNTDNYTTAEYFMRKLKIQNSNTDKNEVLDNRFEIYTNSNRLIKIDGYDYFYPNLSLYGRESINDTIAINIDKNKAQLSIEINKNKYNFDLTKHIRRLIKENSDNPTITLRQDSLFEIKMIIKDMEGVKTGSSYSISYFRTDLLFKFR